MASLAVIVGIVSQKGGVGKSTIARLLAREYANAGWQAKIADLDIAQGTSFSWQARRLRNDIKPVVAVERFGTVEQALRLAEHYDLLILDGPRIPLPAHCESHSPAISSYYRAA
jgi:chromosome partitioning protein